MDSRGRTSINPALLRRKTNLTKGSREGHPAGGEPACRSAKWLIRSGRSKHHLLKLLLPVLLCGLLFPPDAGAVSLFKRRHKDEPDSLIKQSGSYSVGYEYRQAEHYARTLIQQRRYVEAASYLRTALRTLPEGAPRLPLILLLADAQMGIGDVEGARETLMEADGLAITTSQNKAVEKRHTTLSNLPIPPRSPIPVSDSLMLAQMLEELEAEAWVMPVAYITNSFFETDLRQVLTDISMESGVPILWDATVQGLVTYEAVEQPLEVVLKAILMPAGYSFSFQDGAYYVGSSSPKDPAFALLSGTEVVTLSNIGATEAISLLSDYFEPYVKASKTANTVCITAPLPIIDRIRSDLAVLDEPPVQILIEVVVCEFSVDALRKMGLDWSLTQSTRNPTWSVGTDHTDIERAAITGTYTELSKDIGKYTADLTASLEALVESGDAQIRAKPRITTLNGRTAEIALTRDQYFVIQTGTGQFYQYAQLQAVTSGIRLEITPYASETDEITVYVKPEVGDVVGQGAEGLPEITNRTASTSVRVQDGETFTVGGLNLQREKTIRRKVPFLGDIPLLGYLFRYDQREVKDTEIIIFVTPYLLK